MAVDPKSNPAVENKAVTPAGQPQPSPANTMTFGNPNALDPANDPINDPRIAPEVRHEIEKARNLAMRQAADQQAGINPQAAVDLTASYRRIWRDGVTYVEVPEDDFNGMRGSNPQAAPNTIQMQDKGEGLVYGAGVKERDFAGSKPEPTKERP